MSLQSLLVHRMDVTKPIVTTGSTAGVNRKNPWPTVKSEVPCRIQPIGAGRQLQYGQFRINATHIVYYERGTDLTADQRLLIDGKYYRIELLEKATEEGHPNEAMVSEDNVQ